MSVLTIILIVVAAIIVLVLLLALISKNEYAVEREVLIDRPSNEVFNYVKHLKNQDGYNKWVMLDPTMQKTYKGTDGTEGFAYAWDSTNKQAGKGEQTITKIKDGERVDIQIAFIRPFEATADSCILTQPVGDDATNVKWAFKSKMPFPMNAMLLFMDMDKLLGTDLEISLNNLKGILEK